MAQSAEYELIPTGTTKIVIGDTDPSGRIRTPEEKRALAEMIGKKFQRLQDSGHFDVDPSQAPPVPTAVPGYGDIDFGPMLRSTEKKGAALREIMERMASGYK
jgi:hypothetical protein